MSSKSIKQHYIGSGIEEYHLVLKDKPDRQAVSIKTNGKKVSEIRIIKKLGKHELIVEILE